MKGKGIICLLLAVLMVGTMSCDKLRKKGKIVKNGPQQHAPAQPGRPQGQPQPPPPPPPQQAQNDRPGMATEITNTIYGMGGGAAFNAGQKAKQKIKNLGQQHNDQMNRELNK